MTEPEPQVSWKALEQYAPSSAEDGSDQARGSRWSAIPTADIFNGLVVKLGGRDKNRYLPAERVEEIWPRAGRVDLTAAELKALPPYEEPVVERLEPGEPSSRGCGTCSALARRPARGQSWNGTSGKTASSRSSRLRRRRRVGAETETRTPGGATGRGSRRARPCHLDVTTTTSLTPSSRACAAAFAAFSAVIRASGSRRARPAHPATHGASARPPGRRPVPRPAGEEDDVVLARERRGMLEAGGADRMELVACRPRE